MWCLTKEPAVAGLERISFPQKQAFIAELKQFSQRLFYSPAISCRNKYWRLGVYTKLSIARVLAKWL